MLGMLLGAAIALSPAAQEPRCRPLPEPPRPTLIARYQQIREERGFRHDRAYVRRLMRRGIYSRGFDRFPVTRREKRYLEIRDRIGLGPRAERYLRRRPSLDGGISIEDAWPRDPYLLVRLTRDRARHTRALRRISSQPRRLRTKRVALSERALGRLQDRIAFRDAERDGFFIATTAPNIDTTTVDVEVITKRADATEYFRARYGPHVRAKVIATELYHLACTSIYDYRTGPDPAQLTIGWEAGGGARFDHVQVAESEDRVVLGVVVQAPNGPRTAELRREEAAVTLSRPLGDRAVVDATTGKAVPRRR